MHVLVLDTGSYFTRTSGWALSVHSMQALIKKTQSSIFIFYMNGHIFEILSKRQVKVSVQGVIVALIFLE